jgi:ATP-dependent exoDNAse (exonuclease V) beta subunit
LQATKIGGWAPHELHQHEQEEVARDEAEGVRLAYVAATRARDLLVVPALGDEPWDGGWISPLNGALYPPVASRRDGKRGPKCPAFKSKDSVLRRPNEEVAGPGTVVPGLHAFDAAGYSVVWWDPSALELGLKPAFGVRREDLIVKDVPRNVVGDGRSRYDNWQLARARAREAGAIPSLAVVTAREVSEKEESEKVEGRRQKESEKSDFGLQTLDLRLPGDPVRPGGAEFGTLVHAILARVAFDAARAAIDDAASVEARVFGMTDADAMAAAEVAAKVLTHDLLKRAGAADARGVCRRETPVTCTLDDGTLVEGVVDLAFEDKGRWIVVDYKTDREIAEDGEDRYRRQISLYATAIARATGLPAECVLVRV